MQNDLERLLPAKLEGWSIREQDQVYGPDNLYEYINGGAELFLSYEFKKMITRIYSAPEQPEIIVDLFDMGHSSNAYGVFSYSREREDTTFGQGSQYVAGLLLFWKERYYVSILFNPETEEAKKAAFRIAEHIITNIPMEGALPEILNLLPETGLQRPSIRYFRHHIWMNTYLFISNDNILHINDSTHAVLAKYGEKENQQLVLLVEYPNAKDAISAQSDFIENYFKDSSFLPDVSGPTIVANDGDWSGSQVNDNLLIIVLKSPQKEMAEELINQLIDKSVK